MNRYGGIKILRERSQQVQVRPGTVCVSFLALSGEFLREFLIVGIGHRGLRDEQRGGC
jgi:hypothetical protein